MILEFFEANRARVFNFFGVGDNQLMTLADGNKLVNYLTGQSVPYMYVGLRLSQVGVASPSKTKVSANCGTCGTTSPDPCNCAGCTDAGSTSKCYKDVAGSSFSMARTGAGTYTMTVDPSLFDGYGNIITVSVGNFKLPQYIASVEETAANVFTIKTLNVLSGVLEDGLLDETLVEIKYHR